MLRRIGIAVVLEACSSQAPPPPAPHLGDLMTQVGRRFELVGHAMLAKRWELADYEVGELHETFVQLPAALVPSDVHADIPALVRSFVPAIETPLQAAVAKRDISAAAAAFASAAQACNGCHQATGKRFLEVPDKLGDAVPRLDPLP